MSGQREHSQGKVVAMIQARMGSTRLPGKVLAEIFGKPMLWRVVERVGKAKSIDEVIVVTSTRAADEPIVEMLRKQGVDCFRGSEDDVLDRYYQAACEHEAATIVRITSDCPLIDAGVIDKVVSSFLNGDFDYASNGLVRTYPRGLDTEAFTFSALKRAHSEANHPYQRSHVTPYFYENPSLFRILSVTSKEDRSSHRWTVDTKEDLQFVRAVYERMGGGDCGVHEVLQLLEKEPQLSELNRGIVQKALREG